MLRKVFVFPFFLFSCLSVPCFADQAKSAGGSASQTFDLGTVEVSAPAWNYPEEITGRPDGETWFENLSATGRTTIVDALDGQMGLHLRSSGGSGSVAAVSAGGLSGNKILVVKDGMPVNDPFTGTPDIGDFSTLQFDKAEFWEGNRATIWGSNSIGGTLRLSSRFPDHGRLRLWTDGHGGHGESVETRLETGSAKIGLRVGQFATPGISAAEQATGNGERDGFNSDSGYLALETELGKNLQLQLSGAYNESLTDLDGFDFVTALPVDNLFFRQKKISSQINAAVIKAEGNGEFKLTHVAAHNGFSGIDESNPFNEYGFETARQRQAISRSFAGKYGNCLLELARTETHAVNTGILSLRETDRAGIIAWDGGIGDRGSVNAVFRHDDPQNHSAVNTGNLELGYRFAAFDISAAWGRAFRMPALNERYYPAYGDPQLGAEFSTSTAVNLSRLIKGFGRIAAGLTRFRVNDLIGTTSTTDPAYTWGIKAANLDRAEIMSHQLAFSDCKLAGCNLYGNFSWLDKAILEKSGKQAPGVADRQASVMLERKYGNARYALQSRWWGETWENAENTRSAPASHDLSMFIRQTFKECSLEVGLLNLTDTQRQRVLGYTRPGRRLTLAFEAYF